MPWLWKSCKRKTDRSEASAVHDDFDKRSAAYDANNLFTFRKSSQI